MVNALIGCLFKGWKIEVEEKKREGVIENSEKIQTAKLFITVPLKSLATFEVLRFLIANLIHLDWIVVRIGSWGLFLLLLVCYCCFLLKFQANFWSFADIQVCISAFSLTVMLDLESEMKIWSFELYSN